MDRVVIAGTNAGQGLESAGSTGIWLKPLLPNEPRIPNTAAEQALTEQHLLPVMAELEACFLAMRAQLDPELQHLQPVKLGKPYPLGQCLEIAEGVQKCLRTVNASDLPSNAAVGLRALRAFQLAGGTFRQVWGDLRGMYFQNAFQLGTLYVDVSNDTVTPTKPKVEILIFEKAQFVPIRDFVHFRQIASSYWQDEVFPNHVLPELAPYCPFIHFGRTGRIMLHDATQYMLAMTRYRGFEPSEAVLYEDPMPTELFERIRTALLTGPHKLPINPQRGRQLALRYCRQYRAKRWHQLPQKTAMVISAVQQVNLRLAQWHHTTSQQDNHMPNLTIDNVDFDLNSLSVEAKAHLNSIQFVDQELARLQAQTAAMQTARNTYVEALRAALPVLHSHS